MAPAIRAIANAVMVTMVRIANMKNRGILLRLAALHRAAALLQEAPHRAAHHQEAHHQEALQADPAQGVLTPAPPMWTDARLRNIRAMQVPIATTHIQIVLILAPVLPLEEVLLEAVLLQVAPALLLEGRQDR